MIQTVMSTRYPFTLRLTYSEQYDTTALDFMKEGTDQSPLQQPGCDPQTLDTLRSLCKEIIEEPTKRGFRVKFIL